MWRKVIYIFICVGGRACVEYVRVEAAMCASECVTYPHYVCIPACETNFVPSSPGECVPDLACDKSSCS